MSRRIKCAFWVVVAAQVLFLAGFIGFKEYALHTGTEVVLQTVPVDPRSLLQGDYAILDYEIARLAPSLRGLPVGETAYVELLEGPDVWEAGRYSVNRRSVSRIFIKGRVDRPGHLNFGIGTYFVPEGSGRAIESAQGVRVVVKLDADGDAIIKEVLVDGKPFNPDS